MLKKNTVLIVFFIVFLNQSISQTKNNLEDINKVWYKFYQAFDSLDYKLMAEIHSKRLVRISGGKRIIGYDTYISNYKIMFNNAKMDMITNNISLRFFERIHNDSIASERGIYRLVRNKGKNNEQTYYGKFHVIFTKENGQWKISMDYDSNEGNSIAEKDYKESHGINEFDKFIKE